MTDEIQQSQYINMFREQGMNAVILKHNIDSAFITHIEREKEKDNVHFQRIDADVNERFQGRGFRGRRAERGDSIALTELFRKALGKDKLEVKVEKLKNENISSMITLSEESRRMQDMMKMYGMARHGSLHVRRRPRPWF